jgi:hypothetical protein
MVVDEGTGEQAVLRFVANRDVVVAGTGIGDFRAPYFISNTPI